MPRNAPFDAHHRRYENWFATHAAAYCSELLAVRSLLPWRGLGLEVGVGTGRFAAPLGVRVGVDPSAAMLEYARARGIRVVQGVAEQLPFATASFDYALIVTTICFVDDARAMLREARRIIKPDGCLVIGFIDRESALGQEYLAHQAENVFYREATFYSAKEVERLLSDNGFPCQVWVQTLSGLLPEISEIEPMRAGRGNNAFVVVRGMASLHDKLSKLIEGKEMFRRLTDFSAEWLYWRTPEGEMRYVSPASEEITGYSIEELSKFPETCEAMIHPDDRALWFEHIHEADTEGKVKPIEFRILTKQGEIRWISHLCRPIYDKNGEFMGISGSNRDITVTKLAEERLRYLGTHDNLTGLYNRAYFEAEVERLARGRQFPIGVVMADVDGLKEVNDKFGHVAGDQLLQQAAKVLLDTFRAEDVIARVGGDEFAILLPGANADEVNEILKRVRASQEIFKCANHKCTLSLSLGFATARTGKGLLKAFKIADERMYQEKFNRKHRRV
jgi:diguanylate cyclase (GGDEF)-like protein/PAS domain S-box-containing protein